MSIASHKRENINYLIDFKLKRLKKKQTWKYKSMQVKLFTSNFILYNHLIIQNNNFKNQKIEYNNKNKKLIIN